MCLKNLVEKSLFNAGLPNLQRWSSQDGSVGYDIGNDIEFVANLPDEALEIWKAPKKGFTMLRYFEFNELAQAIEYARLQVNREKRKERRGLIGGIIGKYDSIHEIFGSHV